MYKSFVPPYGSESHFNRQILEYPAHLYVTNSDVESSTSYVLTLAATSDPSIVYEVAVSRVNNDTCAIQVSQGFEFYKSGLFNLQGTITLGGDFFGEEVRG